MNYKVYQGTELKQTVTSKMAVMNGLQPNTTYEFSVQPDYQQPDADGKTRYMHVAYANMTYVATENSSFTLSERAIVRFGSDDNWIYMVFDAGTYKADNATFGRDPRPNVVKRAEVVSDFSVEQSANKTYVGFCTDLIQGASTNPLDYTWNPIRDGDATRDGIKETISVKTRGIRINIPKQLTVGATITLRYEEYPLGTIPIGNEPSGMFGGGNKTTLSAKVISTANGSSVVEVAGNVIEVGGRNLIVQSNFKNGYLDSDTGGVRSASIDFNSDDYIATNGETVFTLSSPDYMFKGNGHDRIAMYDSNKNYLGYQPITSATQTLSNSNAAYIRFSINSKDEGNTSGNSSDWLDNHRYKFEKGNVATPYAAFVDGDTFTAQPDGTYALFSEYKALYY